jgi:hypothetical protein
MVSPHLVWGRSGLEREEPEKEESFWDLSLTAQALEKKRPREANMTRKKGRAFLRKMDVGIFFIEGSPYTGFWELFNGKQKTTGTTLS